MKKLCALFLCALCTLIFPAGAGELDELSRELDDIERDFWTAAILPSDSILRREVGARLAAFQARVLTIQNRLREKRIPGVPNLAVPCAELQEIFSMLTPASLSGYRISLKETGMGSYQKEFMRSQRFKKKDGKELPKYPTLKIVNASAYISWVNGICQHNLQKLRTLARSSARTTRSKTTQKRSRPGYRPVSSAVRNAFETYILAIGKLREGLVVLAQNKFYKEPPKPQEPPHVRKHH
ncbi:MAG: hypothetical protein IJS01_15040 [Lentisphaeria bacterium]|nr:hypothetical protein [Lentisphaeria bacterium]